MQQASAQNLACAVDIVGPRIGFSVSKYLSGKRLKKLSGAMFDFDELEVAEVAARVSP